MLETAGMRPSLLAVLVAVGVSAQSAVIAGDAGIFRDGTADAGIRFQHVNGDVGLKRMPEVNGAGASFFDADGDGWIDLLFVQGTTWLGHDDALSEESRAATMKLFRNRRDGSFEDFTERAGLDIRLYGFAAAPADYDNDGDADVYVTAYGRNRLFRNEGGAVFVDVTAEAGVGHPGWSSSAAWLDYDRDGDLDLFVCNYLRWVPSADLYCSIDGVRRSYCNPRAYQGEPSTLYRNDGGRFTDVTSASGLQVAGGKSLGVAVADFSGDGWPDIVVANDTEPDFLFRNRRDGTFDEVGVENGLAVDVAGLARAGMGIDAADIGNDGRFGIAVGNFSNEMIGLYEALPNGGFVDVARSSGVGSSSLTALTFGLFFFDYNLDGQLDLLAVNGHIYEHPEIVEPGVTREQAPLLYRNAGGGRFFDVSREVGGPFEVPIVGRGAAYADIDRDGDLDVAVTTNGGPAHLWLNRARDTAPRPHVLRLRLTADGRDVVGALATLSAEGWRQTQRVSSGSSYLSQSELTLTFGLGSRERLDRLVIDWPDGASSELGAEELFPLIDHEIVVSRESGVVDRFPLEPRGG